MNENIDFEISVGEQLFGANFDKEKYRQDAEKALKEGRDLSFLDKNKYKKQDDDNFSVYSGRGLSFFSRFENGKHIAVGSNGEKIEAKDFNELSLKIAKSFKQQADREGKTSFVRYTQGRESHNTQEELEIQTKNFINTGVGIYGDIPKDPKFWSKFKKEYLEKEGNTLEKWNELTSRIDPQILNEKKKEDKNLSQKLSELSGRKTLSSPQNITKSPQRTNSPQIGIPSRRDYTY